LFNSFKNILSIHLYPPPYVKCN